MQDDVAGEKPSKKTMYQHVMKIFLATFIAVFPTYFINVFFHVMGMNIIAIIASILIFIFVFIWLYKNIVIYKHPVFEEKPRSGGLDYSPGDMNDSRNPFSYTTPGSLNYAFRDPAEERFRNMKSSYDEWNH